MRSNAGMETAGSFLWFARFEARLAWRDALSMIAAGRVGRQRKLAIGVVIASIVLHGVAFLVLHSVAEDVRPDLPILVMVTAGILLSGSAMLAQAMESVTRIFYARSDLELILSAPVKPGKLFAVRIAAMALSAACMSMLVVGPFINVLAWRGGVQWLGAYGVLIALSITTTALAVALTILLFKTIGPARTRLVAQIAAAVIGGMFVIGLQVAALTSTGTMSRFAVLSSPYVLAQVPDIDSAVWYPARAAMGELYSLVARSRRKLSSVPCRHRAIRAALRGLHAHGGQPIAQDGASTVGRRERFASRPHPLRCGSKSESSCCATRGSSPNR